MFERVAGRSRSPQSSKKASLGVALGAHATALLGALWAGLAPAPAPLKSIEVVVGQPRAPLSGSGKAEGDKPKAPRTRTPRPPRAEFARPLPVAPPEEPAPVAEPQPAGPASDAPAVAGPGGDGPAGPGGGEACLSGCAPAPVRTEELFPVAPPSATAPRPADGCEPPHPYAPAAAQQLGLEGRVVARFVVHADGRADSLQVLNPDAPPVFVEAVRDFLARCPYEPSLLDGRPVSVRLSQTFRFRR